MFARIIRFSQIVDGLVAFAYREKFIAFGNVDSVLLTYVLLTRKLFTT